MDMYNEQDCIITFKALSGERNVKIGKVYEDGTPRWTEIVPVFKDFLCSMGYTFPEKTEFVLMPIEE